MKFITPYHYKIYERDRGRWFDREISAFYNDTGVPLDLANIEQTFGLTVEQVIIELFRINGGSSGYYLANLRDRKYYYCGKSWEDIKTTIQSLGIGRADPLEK